MFSQCTVFAALLLSLGYISVFSVIPNLFWLVALSNKTTSGSSHCYGHAININCAYFKRKVSLPFFRLFHIWDL